MLNYKNVSEKVSFIIVDLYLRSCDSILERVDELTLELELKQLFPHKT